jgi:hypothetical protein
MARTCHWCERFVVLAGNYVCLFVPCRIATEIAIFENGKKKTTTRHKAEEDYQDSKNWRRWLKWRGVRVDRWRTGVERHCGVASLGVAHDIRQRDSRLPIQTRQAVEACKR